MDPMTAKAIAALAKQGNVIPVFARIPSDLETPVGAYIKLASGRPYSFLLESVEGGEKLARYSFIGVDPFLVIEGRWKQVIVRQGKKERHIAASPLEFLKELFSVYQPVRIEGLPRFTGGGVGYFSYDAIRWIERVPDTRPDPIGLPECQFGLYSRIVVFDHLRQEIIVIVNVLHDSGQKGLAAKITRAQRLLKETISALQRPLRIPKPPPKKQKVRMIAEQTRPDFETMVRRAEHHIKEGDILQVVLSQRWRLNSKSDPLSVYRNLRRLNPSPYMFLLNFGDNAVIGSSPEMLVRIEDGTIEGRPIAGTRPRGKTDAEDEHLIVDLRNDEKEIAEHTMLLDLGRNDIGRVSVPGSVGVHDNMKVEKYSHVIHLVSSVKGTLKKDISALDAYFACFPAGTVSGAPKIRAMEIIDELEPTRRGVYAGSIAYLDFWGNLDSCIAIRTIVKKSQSYFVQAGAGIVADSNPTREYQETIDKAKAAVAAIRGVDI